MSRFNLDPRAAAARPPPPVVAPAAPPPPRAPPQEPAAPVEGRPRRKLLLVGAALVALLLVGGAVAVYVATVERYPEKYLLQEGERPSGFTNARLTAQERESLGVESNPGQVDPETFSDQYQRVGDDGLDEAHVQVLTTPNGARVVLAALKYADDKSARDAGGEFRAVCSFANGAVLRDGEHLVVVVPDDGATRTQVRTVANAVVQKTPELRALCGI